LILIAMTRAAVKDEDGPPFPPLLPPPQSESATAEPGRYRSGRISGVSRPSGAEHRIAKKAGAGFGLVWLLLLAITRTTSEAVAAADKGVLWLGQEIERTRRPGGDRPNYVGRWR
jgi:hypothetical protein